MQHESDFDVGGMAIRLANRQRMAADGRFTAAKIGGRRCRGWMPFLVIRSAIFVNSGSVRFVLCDQFRDGQDIHTLSGGRSRFSCG
jgi:hypothetical protein